MSGSQLTRRPFLSTASWSAAGLGAAGLLADPAAGSAGDVAGAPDLETEVLVCGGGPAGMAAATLAARQGRPGDGLIAP